MSEIPRRFLKLKLVLFTLYPRYTKVLAWYFENTDFHIFTEAKKMLQRVPSYD